MASQFLPFWRKAAAMAYVSSGTPQYVYTTALPTNGFTEVVSELVVDAEIAANSTITVYPEISNDGINWEQQTNFTAITPGGTYPKKEVIKGTEIAAFMRMKIKIELSTGTGWAGATLYIASTGRS